jgi:hypothetical protein
LKKNYNDLVERLVKLDSEATFPYESQVSSDDRLIGELIRYLVSKHFEIR